MEVIADLNTVEDVAKAYKDNGVSKNRLESLNDKFAQLPKEFTVYGLIFVTLDINGRKIENVPAFAVNGDGSKYVLVGTFKQTYTDKTEPSKITKPNSKYLGKYMFVNNRQVHPIFEGKSEGELIVDVKGKSFYTTEATPFKVFSPKYVDNKPVYGDTPEDAEKLITVKSYPRIIEGKRPVY